jgi:hypothetical protein
VSILRVTIVTFAWPPRNSIAAHRPYNWAKYWSKAGVKVRVVTTKKYPFDAPLDLELSPLDDVEIIETAYLRASIGTKNTKVNKYLIKITKWCYSQIRKIRYLNLNPREKWLRAIRPHIPRLANQCDILVSTYDPKTTHLIASEMKRSNPSIFWIADYRDLWSLNHMTNWSNSRRSREARQEKATVGAYANLLTCVSEEQRVEQQNFLRIETLTAPNGYDLDVEEAEERLRIPLKPVSGPLRIVYTGRVYPNFRDPTPLLNAIYELNREQTIKRGDIILEIYGPNSGELSKFLRNRKFDGILSYGGHVPRERALNIQAGSDFLLLLESHQPSANGVLTGKLFEYIVAGVPILSLGSSKSSAISRVLASTGTGFCAGNNIATIKELLLDRLSGAIHWYSPRIAEIVKFSRKTQALDFLEHIIERYSKR